MLINTCINNQQDTVPAVCFTANEANSTIKLNITGSLTTPTLEISKDGNSWTWFTVWNIITLNNIWDKIYMRTTSTSTTRFGTWNFTYHTFSMTWSISASWNITYLVNKNWTTSVPAYCFYNLFSWCSSLKAAPELPATSLGQHCYRELFANTWIIKAPKLPATTIVGYCYLKMFVNCDLIEAPELPAMNVPNSAYEWMFSWCTNLVIPPKLPATTCDTQPYKDMFKNCSNLEILPLIRLSTIPNYGCNNMFSWCSKIKLSQTQVDEYQTPYEFPLGLNWGESWNQPYGSMFSKTWWTFKWTPTLNTTYYTSNPII